MPPGLAQAVPLPVTDAAALGRHASHRIVAEPCWAPNTPGQQRRPYGKEFGHAVYVSMGGGPADTEAAAIFARVVRSPRQTSAINAFPGAGSLHLRSTPLVTISTDTHSTKAFQLWSP